MHSCVCADLRLHSDLLCGSGGVDGSGHVPDPDVSAPAQKGGAGSRKENVKNWYGGFIDLAKKYHLSTFMCYNTKRDTKDTIH